MFQGSNVPMFQGSNVPGFQGSKVSLSLDSEVALARRALSIVEKMANVRLLPCKG
jgi:hypothetical protein